MRILHVTEETSLSLRMAYLVVVYFLLLVQEEIETLWELFAIW